MYVSLMHRNLASTGTSGDCCGIKDGDKTKAPPLRSEIKTIFRVQNFCRLKIEYVKGAYHKIRLK